MKKLRIMNQSLSRDDKFIIAYLVSSFVIVSLEAILFSSLMLISYWFIPIPVLGFFIMLGFFFYSLYVYIRNDRKILLPIIISSAVFMFSFFLTATEVYAYAYSTLFLSGLGQIVEVQYGFPGQVLLNDYREINEVLTLYRRELVFFVPDFVLWFIMAIPVALATVKQRRNRQ